MVKDAMILARAWATQKQMTNHVQIRTVRSVKTLRYKTRIESFGNRHAAT